MTSECRRLNVRVWPLCAAVAVLPAQAQKAEQAVVLPEIIVTPGQGTLTVPSTGQATKDIQRTPGAVEIVPDTAFKSGPAQTIKDVLGGVPGVVTQSRWGPDARLSIRGSGLSRSFGNRGLNLYLDGIPINTSDGLFDLFEVDPTAYRHVEVFKGANALRFGANSLGGAINFVTPTGRDAASLEARIDAGSFGYLRSQASTGASHGPADWFVTGSGDRWDGYRDHSAGHQGRFSGNYGYRLSQDVETRFYLNANTWRSRLPGEVTKTAALNSPKAADEFFTLVDQQRNIDSARLANKTTLRFGSTTVDVGLFSVYRHVDHPIFQYLDYHVDDYGGFTRVTDDRLVGRFRNRLIAGVNLHNGKIDTEQFVNLPGAVKGALVASTVDRSQNVSVYAENSFFFRPSVAFVAGMQFLSAVRDRRDRFLSNGDQSGRRSYDIWSPKFGLLWDVDPTWQVFGNVSRSAEVPTYDVTTFATPASTTVKAQTATTYELGTRGRRPDVAWDVAIYRARIRDELQCLTNPATPGACSVSNADRTVHQGIELGLGGAFFKSIFAKEDRLWFNVAYTYNDFSFDGDPTYGSNRLPGVPPHFIRAEMLYKRSNGFFAGPNAEWSPRHYLSDNANQVTVDQYVLWNFRIGYDNPRAGWGGYVEARNLFDKRYIASAIVVETANAESALFNPGTGRAIYGGFRFTW